MKKWCTIVMSATLILLLGVGCMQSETASKSEVTKENKLIDEEQVSYKPDEKEVEEAAVEEDTILFTDSCGRQVTLPAHLTRVAPSGSVAQMILYAVAPDKLACWAGTLGDEQKDYIDDKYEALPVTGQFYGKGDLNMEALIAAAPDVIIDLGDQKEGIVEDLDNIQEQTGIPVIFIEATVETYPQMFRTLGELLGDELQGKRLAAYTEATYKEAEEARTKISESEEGQLRVMFGTGKSGLDCNAKGSIHCGVLEGVGVENAIEVADISQKGGGNTVTMEEVISADPDVILLEAGGPYETINEDPYWSALTAVKEGKVYEIPYGPYHFLSRPPSINQIIGIKWLGKLLYPEFYQEDMIVELQNYYALFWHYELSKEEAKALLAHSTYKE